MGTIILISTVHLRKRRHRKIKSLVEVTASRWLSWICTESIRPQRLCNKLLQDAASHITERDQVARRVGCEKGYEAAGSQHSKQPLNLSRYSGCIWCTYV